MSRKIGLEIECIGLTPSELARGLAEQGVDVTDAGYTHDVFSNWKTVPDGSLRRRAAAELVSPPIVWDAAGKAEVFKVLTALEALGVSTDERCGFHVHVDASDLNANQVRNVFRRYRAFETKIDALLHRRRRGNANNYCRSLRPYNFDAPITSVSQMHRAFTGAECEHRYHKVNYASFLKYGTIEFRQHQGTVRYSDVLNWVTFCVGFLEQSKVIVEPVAAPAPSNVRVCYRPWFNPALCDFNANRIYGMLDRVRRAMYQEMVSHAANPFYRMSMDAVGLYCPLAIREVMKFMGVRVKVYKVRGAKFFYVKDADRIEFVNAVRALVLAHEELYDSEGRVLPHAEEVRAPAAAPGPIAANDDMWLGIDPSTRSYYRIRQATLA